MKNGSALISCIIPVYNREGFLDICLKSVFAQTYSNFEVIVVDDGSIDRSAEISEKYPLNLLRQDNKGAGTARNFGVLKSKGEYIAFLDADDYWHPEKLELQLQIFKQYPEMDIVFTNLKQVRYNSNNVNKALIEDVVYAGYIPSSVMIKREVFYKVGQFSGNYKLGEFIEWMGRARNLHLNEMLLKQTLTFRGIHGDNSSMMNSNARSDYVKIIAKHLKNLNILISVFLITQFLIF